MVKLRIENFNKLLARLSKREKLVLYVASLFVLITILDRLIVFPVYSKIKSLNSEIKEKETGIVNNLRILELKDRILAEKNKYSSFLNKPKSEEEEMTTLLKQVENLANKSSLYIIDMKPVGLKEDSEKNKRFMMNLSCEGQMEQIIDFMYNIENSGDLLVVEKYQIAQKSKESSVLEASMSISKVLIP